jgi:hypothetical protein
MRPGTDVFFVGSGEMECKKKMQVRPAAVWPGFLCIDYLKTKNKAKM